MLFDDNGISRMKWLAKKQTSPVTGESLPKTLFLNINLKKVIREFVEEKKKKNAKRDEVDHVAEQDGDGGADEQKTTTTKNEGKKKRKLMP